MILSPGRGVILAAPTSGSGKTTITLGLLRAFRQKNLPVWGAKSGPDYIDVRFHEAASGARCFNLDAWAMVPDRIRRLAALPGLGLIEGAMGLFDGAPPEGKGSVADLARILKLPVVLVVDAARMAQSIAPMVAGFAKHDPSVTIAGVILNKVGSDRHERMLRTALKPLGIPVLGAIPRAKGLTTPSRHLGLVQAQERPDLEHYLDAVAQMVSERIDLAKLEELAGGLPAPERRESAPPATKTIAVAKDQAFDFSYQHLMQDLIMDGWEIRTFSPLRNEAVPEADLVYLPGGYPELHAHTLANNSTFIDSLRKTAETTDIYGECGGYMVLGERLTDAEGVAHKMAGLLPLETSFADRKLHLGYRHLTSKHPPYEGAFRGHEFHYATTVRAEGAPMFEATDAEGASLPDMGLRRGRVCGSFAHIIEGPLPRLTGRDTGSA